MTAKYQCIEEPNSIISNSCWKLSPVSSAERSNSMKLPSISAITGGAPHCTDPKIHSLGIVSFAHMNTPGLELPNLLLPTASQSGSSTTGYAHNCFPRLPPCNSLTTFVPFSSRFSQPSCSTKTPFCMSSALCVDSSYISNSLDSKGPLEINSFINRKSRSQSASGIFNTICDGSPSKSLQQSTTDQESITPFVPGISSHDFNICSFKKSLHHKLDIAYNSNISPISSPYSNYRPLSVDEPPKKKFRNNEQNESIGSSNTPSCCPTPPPQSLCQFNAIPTFCKTNFAFPGSMCRNRTQPSRFCHICSRTSKKVALVTCTNFISGACRKVICEKCFNE